jgi:putative DNA primase/helicase
MSAIESMPRVVKLAQEALQRVERFAGEHEVALKVLEDWAADSIRADGNMTLEERAELERKLNPDRLRVVTSAEFLKMEFPPREFILEPILQTQGTAMLYSKRGVGKTYLSLGIACGVAAGGAFLRWRAPKPRRVLYVDGEMPAVTMRERLASIIAGMEAEMDPAYFRLITPDLQDRAMPSLSGTVGQSRIEDELADSELLILDNISALCRDGKENEAESWLSMQEWILSLRRRGISVLFDHHAGRSVNARGTTKREDLLDTSIVLRHPQDYEPSEGARFEVHFEKSRNAYGDDVEPFEVRMQTENGAAVWLISNLADVTVSRVVDLLGEGLSIRKIASELNIDKSKVERIKKKFGERHA